MVLDRYFIKNNTDKKYTWQVNVMIKVIKLTHSLTNNRKILLSLQNIKTEHSQIAFCKTSFANWLEKVFQEIQTRKSLIITFELYLYWHFGKQLQIRLQQKWIRIPFKNLNTIQLLDLHRISRIFKQSSDDMQRRFHTKCLTTKLK